MHPRHAGIVGMIVGMIASGQTKEDLLRLYPYLEAEDIDQALSYAACEARRSGEIWECLGAR